MGVEHLHPDCSGPEKFTQPQNPAQRPESRWCLTQSANVFLSKSGTAKLGDLNVSKVTRKGFSETQTGTPYYASPEVWKD